MLKKYAVIFCFFAIVLGLNLHFRSFSIYFPQLKQQAQFNVDKKLLQQAQEDVDKRYPGLLNAQRLRLIKQQMRDFKRSKPKDYQKQVRDDYDRLKDPFQDQYGTTYLMELDCWNWARYVANIGRYGHIGDEKRNGRSYDSLMLAPQGSLLLWNNFFFYSSWVLYRAFSSFRAVPIFHFLFYLPLFFVIIFISLLFVFCYRYWGLTVAVIACLFAGLTPILIPRSSAGWFDMDVLNLIFPLAICWAYIRSYHAPSFKLSLALIFFAAFWLGLFCATWIAYPFIIFIILFFEAVYLANAVSESLQYKTDNRAVIVSHLVHPALFLAASACWMFIFCGTAPFESLMTQVREAVDLNKAVTANIWPNVYSTVGELKNTDYVLMAQSTGGLFLYLSGLACMLLIFLRLKRFDAILRDFAMIMVVWFIVMYLFCSKGVRFTMFLGIPLGIFLGWGIDEAWQHVRRRKNRYLTAALAVFMFLIARQFLHNGYKNANGVFPLIDDTWYSVLTSIKQNTPRDAVINSWWDFGDWFKVIAERKVIFDGQSQNTPQAYWMARMLLTDSEQEALGILRMLNNGGNRAFEEVHAALKDPYRSVFLLRQALALERAGGQSLLRKNLPADVALRVEKLLYDKPPAAYFIVDSTMVGKMPAITFLGSWDFMKKYIVTHVRSKSQQEITDSLAGMGVDTSEVASLYLQAQMLPDGRVSSWITRRLALSNSTFGDKKDDGLVLFDNGFVFNPANKQMYSYYAQEGRFSMPQSLFMEEKGQLSEIAYPKSDARYSTLLLDGPDTYKIINADNSLLKSMFVKLHFLGGRGLRHFKPFIIENAQNNHVGVFEIVWD